ncbi:MAG: GAF domain-containing protein [Candidatus Electrothrix sp. YB6]
MQKLRQTLFWKCFFTKRVVFVDRFTKIQQEFTKHYKSGLVAPVILHGIPYALLCIGSKKENVFNEDDVQLACTFADSLAEYIRLERSLSHIVKNRKVVVLGMERYIEEKMISVLDNVLVEMKDSKQLT